VPEQGSRQVQISDLYQQLQVQLEVLRRDPSTGNASCKDERQDAAFLGACSHVVSCLARGHRKAGAKDVSYRSPNHVRKEASTRIAAQERILLLPKHMTTGRSGMDGLYTLFERAM
jgi:hypothetical protein